MKRLVLLLLLGSLALLLAACAIEDQAAAPTSTPTPPDYYTPEILSAFQALPEEVAPTDYAMSEELVDLGRMLFYEERISISQAMSCNTCHLLDNYGVDGLPVSLGHDGLPVARNAPTVYNAAIHISQFWDGRAADVEEQAQGPILAAGEMGMPNPDYVVSVLRSIPGYLPLFQAAFPGEVDPINYSNVGKAIGAFERRLMTHSGFDDLLGGDETALNAQEKRGLALFVSTGCASCHYGEAIGGERYAVLGQAVAYPNLTDKGRYVVTGDEADRYAFKVPSLRNIAETGPYLHDGSIVSLEEIITLMATHQLSRELTDAQVGDIAAFLNALTGPLPQDYIFVPEFPASGPDTPGPYEAES
jgi:cytochrome c peroxidase